MSEKQLEETGDRLAPPEPEQLREEPIKLLFSSVFQKLEKHTSLEKELRDLEKLSEPALLPQNFDALFNEYCTEEAKELLNLEETLTGYPVNSPEYDKTLKKMRALIRNLLSSMHYMQAEQAALTGKSDLLGEDETLQPNYQHYLTSVLPNDTIPVCRNPFLAADLCNRESKEEWKQLTASEREELEDFLVPSVTDLGPNHLKTEQQVLRDADALRGVSLPPFKRVEEYEEAEEERPTWAETRVLEEGMNTESSWSDAEVAALQNGVQQLAKKFRPSPQTKEFQWRDYLWLREEVIRKKKKDYSFFADLKKTYVTTRTVGSVTAKFNRLLDAEPKKQRKRSGSKRSK